MRPSKFNCIVGISVMALLLCARAAVSPGGAPPALTGGQIFETVRENYASLFSYSDKGQIVTTMGGSTNTIDFTTRMARPGFYRVQWDQKDQTPYTSDDTGLLGAWCSGAGDYMQIGMGVRRHINRDDTLVQLRASSGGAVANIPAIFFDAQGSSTPNKIICLDRLQDDKIGKIDCYVVTGQLASGQTETFWIGKDDLLIHEIDTEVSPTVMQASLESATGGKWQAEPYLYGSSSIETFTNIVVDQQFLRTDFIPTFPLFESKFRP